MLILCMKMDIIIRKMRQGKYLDYKIAQHSDNYNAWASEEVNHWDEQEGDGARYGRVRR